MIFHFSQRISQRSAQRSKLRSFLVSSGSKGFSSIPCSGSRGFSSTVSYVMDENFVKFQLYEVLKVESELFEKVFLFF
jgi:hypothetical protein